MRNNYTIKVYHGANGLIRTYYSSNRPEVDDEIEITVIGHLEVNENVYVVKTVKARHQTDGTSILYVYVN